jgi:hypothetical protein
MPNLELKNINNILLLGANGGIGQALLNKLLSENKTICRIRLNLTGLSYLEIIHSEDELSSVLEVLNLTNPALSEKNRLDLTKKELATK